MYNIITETIIFIEMGDGGRGGGPNQTNIKVPHKTMVPNMYVLRSYAGTPLCVWYCINKYTL